MSALKFKTLDVRPLIARGADGEMRAFELPDHPFFVATLFQPQLSSSFDAPHPIVLGFLRAALAR